MGYNVKRVRMPIRHVRADPGLEKLKVVVGGHAFNNVDWLWKVIGAGGFSRTRRRWCRWST